MGIIKVFFALAVILQLAGCAFGQRIDYRQAVPAVNVSTESEVSVAVVDERPYVTAGRKNQSYVGNFRALYYNPFNVNTASGRPLAIDLQNAIIAGLDRSGIKAQHHIERPVRSERAGQRLLLIKVGEWKSDTYMRTRFDYDISAAVYDEKGKVLGSSRRKGSGPIANFLTAGSEALGSAINDEKVKSALVGGGPLARDGKAAAPAPARLSGSVYDSCMARVMRISDSALRLRAMSACDGAQ